MRASGPRLSEKFWKAYPDCQPGRRMTTGVTSFPLTPAGKFEIMTRASLGRNRAVRLTLSSARRAVQVIRVSVFGFLFSVKEILDFREEGKAVERKRLKQGMVQVYTGDGKGKTTCALGLALRATGQGFKVCMVQFMKGRDTGEARAAARLAPEFTLRYFGRPGLVNLKAPDPEDLALIKAAWELARKAIGRGDYDLVILDEINLALAYGLIPLTEMLTLLRERPPFVEVVLTGRQAPPELMEFADLVTEMRPVKHY